MAYVNVPDYVTTYGERETTLLTNEVPQGPGVTYDPEKVEAALSDATDEVEGYVSRRYETPIASPPPIVRGWVKAIARLKLAEATGRVSDAIKEAADRATRQLEQVAASKINLPVPDGGTALPENSGGDPLSSNDRDPPTFTRRSLAGYNDVFTGGAGCLPNWMRD